MNDNPIYALILSILNGQLADVGLSGTVIVKGFQDVRQGVEASSLASPTKAAYLVKLFDIRDGYPRETDVWDSTIQLSTLAVQTPGNTTQLTASDVANLLAMILQNSNTMSLFQAQGVGILD